MSNIIDGTSEFAVDLAEALGLGKELRIVGFTLRCHVDEVVRAEVTAELLNTERQVVEITKVLRRHGLEFVDA